jgi:hypothetical protein
MPFIRIKPSNLDSSNDFSSFVGSAYGTANSAAAYANASFLQANAAFVAANSGSGATAASSYANAAFLQANAAFIQANSGGAGTDTYARDTANASFLQANSSYSSQNTTGTYANAAYTQANTATTNSATADDKAVTSGSYANSSYAQANASFDRANSALVLTPPESGSVSFNGSTQSLTVPVNAAFAFGTGDFTIESWFYLTAAGDAYRFIYSQARTGTSLDIRFGNDGFGNKLQVSLNSGTVGSVWSCNITQTSAIGSWKHVALTRSGSTCRLFVNGVQQSLGSGANPGSFPVTSFTDSSNIPTPTSTIKIGQTVAGYISNLRVINGTAVYTSTFTPPTSPLTSTGSGTSLLLGTVNGAGFLTDSSPYNSTVTNVGASTSSALSPTWDSSYINAAYAQANIATSNAATASLYANAAFLQANTPPEIANSAALYANAAFIQANAAYAQANSGGAGTDTYARDTANASFVQANAAFVKANTTSGNGVVRVVTVADITTITMNANTSDIVIQTNTQLAGTLTVATSGTPLEGQKIILRLQSANVQTFSWDTVFAGSTDMILPTVSSANNKYDYMGFIYNSISTKWQLIAKNFGF